MGCLVKPIRDKSRVTMTFGDIQISVTVHLPDDGIAREPMIVIDAPESVRIGPFHTFAGDVAKLYREQHPRRRA